MREDNSYYDDEVCGLCKFCTKEGNDWICSNEKSECYGCSMAYRDTCLDFERKGEKIWENHRTKW